jgi:23S rRNA (uracil1939-C5)-methyltransferase
MGTNKISSFENVRNTNAYFCAMAKKNTDKVVFHQIKVIDAGAKGVSVAKAPDGKVVFIYQT